MKPTFILTLIFASAIFMNSCEEPCTLEEAMDENYNQAANNGLQTAYRIAIWISCEDTPGGSASNQFPSTNSTCFSEAPASFFAQVMTHQTHVDNGLTLKLFPNDSCYGGVTEPLSGVQEFEVNSTNFIVEVANPNGYTDIWSQLE